MNQLSRFLLLLLLAAALTRCKSASGAEVQDFAKSSAAAGLGELGGDLAFLAKFYTPPQGKQENNHYIDLWQGRQLAIVARANGLTQNRALFVNSHGKAVGRGQRARFGYYPHKSLLAPRQEMPYFTARDLAQLIGPEQAAQIHNILIAGCNAEGVFNAQELRKYFVNATNITHMPAGELGYQPMFLQALVNHSKAIKPLYETCRKNSLGLTEYQLGTAPARQATRLSPYVAELFRPGEKKPFKTQVAGRELLDPPNMTLAQRATPAGR